MNTPVYIIEEHSEGYYDTYDDTYDRFDLGYLTSKSEAEEFAAALTEKHYQEWAKRRQQLHIRAVETFLYPELKSEEELLLERLFADRTDTSDPTQEMLDTSKKAYYEDWWNWRTFKVKEIKPRNP